MHEYGIGLRELDTFWTPGRTLGYLRKIADRYRKQTKARKGDRGAKVMAESQLMKSDFARG